MKRKKKKEFNYELIRNAEQFLNDLNTAKKYKDEMREIDARYYETPEWFQNIYNQAMQDLGRWLVRDYQENNDYMDALESIGDTDF